MAKAALISWDPQTNEVTADPFDSEDGFENPVQAAKALGSSVEDDWPQRLFTVIADGEAKELRSQQLMKDLGFE